MVQIGYTNYAISHEDAIALLGIASRMREVANPRYGDPFVFVNGGDPIVTGAQLIDVIEPSVEIEQPQAAVPIAMPPADPDLPEEVSF